MKHRKAALLAAIAAAALLTTASSCDDPNVDEASYKQVDEQAADRTPYLPKNDVEFDNYNRAQQLYDSPDAIIWCTTTWGNASAPLVTVPVAGKLTSSSVSYFPNGRVDYNSSGNLLVEARSVDGMFHGSPPPYRYGFTPGGQYIDFFNMPTFCTTALTEFQRQQTALSITVDDASIAVQQQAEQALKDGDAAKAQDLLDQLAGASK